MFDQVHSNLWEHTVPAWLDSRASNATVHLLYPYSSHIILMVVSLVFVLLSPLFFFVEFASLVRKGWDATSTSDKQWLGLLFTAYLWGPFACVGLFITAPLAGIVNPWIAKVVLAHRLSKLKAESDQRYQNACEEYGETRASSLRPQVLGFQDYLTWWEGTRKGKYARRDTYDVYASRAEFEEANQWR